MCKKILSLFLYIYSILKMIHAVRNRKAIYRAMDHIAIIERQIQTFSHVSNSFYAILVNMETKHGGSFVLIFH